MSIPEKIHVFTTNKCNLKCAYCFREDSPEGKPENLIKISEILAENNVKKIVIGGGEPLLVKNLEDMLKILKKADISVDVHTNCTLLNSEKLKSLQGLVDKIGIPIDTLDEKIQCQLRGYTNYVKLIKEVTKDAQKLGFEIVFHTVAFDTKEQKIPQLYKQFIINQNFDCWKIYEYNEKLAMQKSCVSNKIDTLEYFTSENNVRTGGTDSNLAEFLLLEEKMRTYKDKRIKLIGVLYSKDYFFINSKGDAKYYTWYAPQRITFGNLFKDDFKTIIQKFNKIEKEFREERSEDFFGTLNCMPLFARYWEGNCFWEELDEVDGRHASKFYHLAKLWEKHVLRTDR